MSDWTTDWILGSEPGETLDEFLTRSTAQERPGNAWGTAGHSMFLTDGQTAVARQVSQVWTAIVVGSASQAPAPGAPLYPKYFPSCYDQPLWPSLVGAIGGGLRCIGRLVPGVGAAANAGIGAASGLLGQYRPPVQGVR